MIDTHLHILPGVDDGPATLNESLELASSLVQERVHTVIATPHYNDQYPRRGAAEIVARVYELQQALYRSGIPLRVFAGHEVLIKPGLVEDIQMGRVCTLAGSRYLLLELWNTGWVPATEQVIFELQAFGVIPVIAHPERYTIFQKDPPLLATLLRQGVLTQVTLGALIGMQGNTIRRAAEALLKKGLVSCLASDAHGMHKRPPGVAKGMERACKLVGREATFAMVETRPAAILQNAVSGSGSLHGVFA